MKVQNAPPLAHSIRILPVGIKHLSLYLLIKFILQISLTVTKVNDGITQNMKVIINIDNRPLK